MKPQQALARAVRGRRAELKLSQEALGERCGLHRTEISLLERELRDPKLSTLFRLAEALELTPSELLARTE